MTSEPINWWETEDPGGWPLHWHSPHPPSLSRPPEKRWVVNPDFRLRPHP